MFWIKAAAVIGYFLGTMFFSQWQLIAFFENEFQVNYFVRTLVPEIVFFYGLAWLYKWVVRSNLKMWHKESAMVVACGIGMRICADLLMLLIYRGDLNLFRIYIVFYSFLINLSMVGTLLLIFYVIDKRKNRKNFAEQHKRIGIAAIIIFLACIGGIVINTCMNTPIQGLEQLETTGDVVRWLMALMIEQNPELTLSEINYKLGIVAYISIFLFLWLKTIPRKKIYQ